MELRALRQIAEKEAKKARDAAVDNPDDPALQDDAVAKAQAAEEIEVPSVPRLFGDDITRAALGQQLAEQHGRLAIISAEGGVFDQIASRQSGQMQIDYYLKGHCGDPIRIDRKKQPPLRIPRPALTVGVMLQPDLLRAIGQPRQFRGRGLLARFLYALPESRVGRRRRGDPGARRRRRPLPRPHHRAADGDDAVGWTSPRCWRCPRPRAPRSRPSRRRWSGAGRGRRVGHPAGLGREIHGCDRPDRGPHPSR